MRLIYLISLFISGILDTAAQIHHEAEKFALPGNLSESSGLIFFNDKLVTHNDSGGDNTLFEVDTLSGLVTRIITISNATNVDWEDISQDDTSIYIGDIGNNEGNRNDLKIYKINKTDFLNTNSVMAETIRFSYADQLEFTPSLNNNIWDAEALVSFDEENLILFNKNWIDGITKAYLVPKAPGDYSISPLAHTLESGGFITGGTYNPLTKKLYLVGYIILQPFVWVSEHFNGSDIFSGINTKTGLTSFGLEQVEAITFVSENRYFLTSESFNQSIFSDDAKLMSFSTRDIALSVEDSVGEKNPVLYPNPVNNFLNVKDKNVVSIEIFDTKSVQIYSGSPTNVAMGLFSNGFYFVKINFSDGSSHIKKILKN